MQQAEQVRNSSVALAESVLVVIHRLVLISHMCAQVNSAHQRKRAFLPSSHPVNNRPSERNSERLRSLSSANGKKLFYYVDD